MSVSASSLYNDVQVHDPLLQSFRLDRRPNRDSNSGSFTVPASTVAIRLQRLTADSININRQSTTNVHRCHTGAPAGFQARVGKIRRKAPKIFFRLPTLVFRLPTLPYVTVAHPAHRTEADLRGKALLATNQEGPLPSSPLPSV